MKTQLITAVTAVAMLAASHAGAQTWQGPYVGGTVRSAHLAGGEDETLTFDTDLDGSYGDTVPTYTGGNAFAGGFCDGLAAGTMPETGCVGDREKAGIGVRAGYDFQFGHVVLGVVGEVDTSEYRDSVSGFASQPSFAPDRHVFTREVRNTAALRLRAGYAAGDWLVYATGGAAQADVRYSFQTTNPFNSFSASDGDDGLDGSQWGLGVEKRCGNWAFGLEYLRTELDDDGVTVHAGASAATFASNPFLITNTGGTDIRRGDDRFKIDSVVLTVSYRFGRM